MGDTTYDTLAGGRKGGLDGKMRMMAVPTDDTRVKARLREIGEPITLFGERAADRRDRLIYVLSQITAARGDDAMRMDEASTDSEEEEEEFYSPGSLELLETRRRIAEFSLPRAQKRVAQQRLDSKIDLGRIVDIRKKMFTEVKKFAHMGSQIGDERPISHVRFSPNTKILAAGSWSGTVKLWNVPSCTPIRSLRGHADRVGGVAWHPQATISLEENLANLASGAADGRVNLWSLTSDLPVSVLKGHQGRVSRISFHPSGDYIASASFDTTWRLWDVQTSKEILMQEGHSRELYTVDFQSDGSLLASGGLDAIGRVWDLRTGRTAMVLDGHVRPILGLAFSPNGYQLASGSVDDTIRIWDIRSLVSLYTIPAHLSNVSDLRFFHANDVHYKPTAPAPPTDVEMNGRVPEEQAEAEQEQEARKVEEKSEDLDDEEWGYRSGLFFASSGYDGFVKLWSADDWQLLRTLTTDAGKVMSVDISSDGKLIASSTYTRNFQLFSPDV